MKRRQVLAALGTSALASVAGCATLEAELGLRKDRLGTVTLANGVAEPFEVLVEVLRNDTVVHQSSYQLDPGTEQERPQYTINEWDDDPTAQRWTVRTKLPDNGWREATIDAARGQKNECYSVAVVVNDLPERPLLVLLGGCELDRR
jgi:hypothetical protein